MLRCRYGRTGLWTRRAGNSGPGQGFLDEDAVVCEGQVRQAHLSTPVPHTRSISPLTGFQPCPSYYTH